MDTKNDKESCYTKPGFIQSIDKPSTGHATNCTLHQETQKTKIPEL